MRATPINEAEAVFERFYDPLRSGFPRWTVAPDPATGAKAWQNWCGVWVDWNTGGGRTVATLTATPQLELEAYDHLMLRLSLPTTARMNVWGIIDGERTLIIPGARGENRVSEFSGPVRGRCLSNLQLEIQDDGSVPGTAILLWIGLFEEERQRRMHARAAAAFDGWGDLLLPPEQVVEQPAPLLGVFFGGEDLDALRRKAASPPYALLVEGLRGIARSHLRDEPWKQVSQFASPYGPDLLGRTPQNLDPIAMRICSFVGLLDRDPALLRMALNHALSAAHCEYWCDSFLSTMPGTTWEHRAFIAFGLTTSVIFAWDWAGSYLTPAGREVLAQAVAIKGLPWIQLALKRWSYMRGCNQGAFHAYGALVAEAALARAWPPHGGEGIEVARAAMDQTMDAYVAADGGAFEGPLYYEATLSATLVGYAAYARLKGLPLARVVPPGLANAGRYLVAMLSTAGPPGSFVNVGDGGRPEHTLMPDALASLEAFGNDPDVAALIATILPTAHLRETNRVFPGSAFNIILGPATLPPAAVKPPVFALLPDTGMLCSCRPTPHGPVRLQVVGAPANAGHSHDDKGSFILEAFGEEIAIDRGQMTYEDPRAGVIGYAVYHNLLIPHLSDGVPARQINPCPQAIIPIGSGDERSLHARIDAGAAYPELVVAWTRSFDSDEPMEFTITDDLRLTKPMAAGFHVHSRFPWTKTPEGWVTRGQAAELLVISAPGWTPAAETGCEDFIDGLRKPAHHLTLISPSASEHHLRTRLRVRSVK